MLKDKRQMIIDYVKANSHFLSTNYHALSIYDGNLRPYVDEILRTSLSPRYYNSIKDRILPINILQRYIDKVSTTYAKEPLRLSLSGKHSDFLEFYSSKLSIDNSGVCADTYANLFKGFAWEPYISRDGKPSLRELSFDRFLVMSESAASPDEETIFIKLMGKKSSHEDSMLLFVYTDDEFDAFYMDGTPSMEHLSENQGVNLIGTIPFVYGKRQKNRLLPVLDSDMLSIAKAIPVMLSDAAGAQMYQCFSILYGIDINSENMVMSPNAFWSMKSDKDSDKNPQVGVIKPEADTQKVLDFVNNIFIMWLETKGIRIGSMGSAIGGSLSSGISKIIDEMDVYEVKKKSMEWFKKDEEELWNKKLPMIHNYWIQSGMVNPSDVPALITDIESMDIDIEFEKPSPMITRSEEINNIKLEVELGTMTMEDAVKSLHPDYTEEDIAKTLANKVMM